MPPLPVISGAQLVRVLEELGWTRARQKGSHVQMKKDGQMATVPLHGELKRGTLKGILNSAGVSVDALLELL